MSLSIPAIRAANKALLSQSLPAPVAVFVGGTAGIGEATLRAFAASTPSPRIYIVGRSAAAAATITAAVAQLNPAAEVTFLRADLSLMSATADVAAQIRAREHKINLLFMTTGALSVAGHTPTADGIEFRVAIQYFSRLLFAQALLGPLLAAQSEDPLGARVVSVYSPQTAGPVVANDLGLADPKNFSLRQSAAQGTALNNLALEHLAKEHPGVGWVHAYPSAVNTNAARELPWVLQKMISLLDLPLLNLIYVKNEDCGQGFLRISTAAEYKKGFHMIDWKGGDIDTRKGSKWWKEGLADEIWEGTKVIWKRVLGDDVFDGLGK